MAIKWISSSKGIRYYEHPSRKYGKRPDRYYSLTYKLDGKVKCEGLGWESENRVPGESLQNRGERLLAQLRENQRTGQGPRTLAEMHDEGAKKREAEAETRRLRSLDDFFESEFKPFAARSLKEKSARSEFSLYRLWIQPLIGNKPLVNITLADWSELVKNMMGRCSPRSIEYATGVLRRIFKRPAECGHMGLVIPSKKQLGIKAIENRRLRVLNHKECRAILNALEDREPCAYRLTFFAMLTGCRAGEAIALK